jgi:UDP-N-acetylmuramate dehydrogenase
MTAEPVIQHNKLLSELSTFGIGGPARYFTEVRTPEQMQAALKKCQREKIPFITIGKGSNCLFDDRGYNGMVILNKIDFLKKPGEGLYYVGAGYSFSLLGSQTARQGWSGLEFASGIPGTVGGAIFMNAGANGKETCESLLSVQYMNFAGQEIVFEKRELEFSYRHSPFQKMSGAIIAGTFKLASLPEARQHQLKIIDYRKKTQPYSEMSAGCIFRNPDNAYAGALIDKCGLKHLQIGDAKVSEMHANFIVNMNKATSKQVLELIETIQIKVKESTGIELESEVRYIQYEQELP